MAATTPVRSASNPGWDRMTGPADRHGTEVHRDHIKGGFRTAHDRSGHAANEAVRTSSRSTDLNELIENAIGTTPTERTHEDQRQKFHREVNGRKHRSQKVGDHLDSARLAEHAHRHQDGNEIGNDADGHVKSLFGAFDKFLVNGDAFQSGVERKEGEQKRHRQQRDGLHAGSQNKPWRVAGAARRTASESKVDKKSKVDKEHGIGPPHQGQTKAAGGNRPPPFPPPPAPSGRGGRR